VATPKLTKSESESSSAPKREVPFSRRARRPSTPSSAAAIRMQIGRDLELALDDEAHRGQAEAQAPAASRHWARSAETGIGLKRARFDSTRSGSKGGKRSLMRAGIRGFEGGG
jgi:hypothetical protein